MKLTKIRTPRWPLITPDATKRKFRRVHYASHTGVDDDANTNTVVIKVQWPRLTIASLMAGGGGVCMSPQMGVSSAPLPLLALYRKCVLHMAGGGDAKTQSVQKARKAKLIIALHTEVRRD
jgi:hypothetical protein